MNLRSQYLVLDDGDDDGEDDNDDDDLSLLQGGWNLCAQYMVSVNTQKVLVGREN